MILILANKHGLGITFLPHLSLREYIDHKIAFVENLEYMYSKTQKKLTFFVLGGVSDE